MEQLWVEIHSPAQMEANPGPAQPMVKPGPRQALVLCKLMASLIPFTPVQPQTCLKIHVGTPPLLQIGSLRIMNQVFGLSQLETGEAFEHGVFDGLLGLGFPSLALKGTTPIFDNLKKQGQISEPVFAFYLST